MALESAVSALGPMSEYINRPQGVMKGIMNWQDIAKMRVANQLADENLRQQRLLTPFITPEHQAALDKTLLENQYYPKLTESEIGLRNATAEEILKGRIPLDIASAGKENVETQFIPLRNIIDASNSLRAGSRFGDAYQFSKVLQSLPAASRAQYIAENQDAYNNMINTLGNKTAQQEAGIGPTLIDKVLRNMYPGLMQDNGASQQVGQPQAQQTMAPQELSITPQQAMQISQKFGGNSPLAAKDLTITPEQAKALANNGIGEIPSAYNSSFGTSPDQTEKLRLSNQLAANQKSSGAQMSNRAVAAIEMHNWLDQNRDEFSQRILNATKYAGVKGLAERGLASALPKTSKEYEDYVWYKNSFLPHLENRTKMLERLSSSSQQRKGLEEMFNQATRIDLDPQAAGRAMNDAIKTLSGVEEAVISAAEPHYKGVYKKLYNLSDPHDYLFDNPTVTDKDIGQTGYDIETFRYAAKKAGVPLRTYVDNFKKRI